MRRIKYKKVRRVQPNFFEYTGIYTTEPVAMQLFVYNDEGYEEYHDVTLHQLKKELHDPLQSDDKKWLNIHGLHDTELVHHLGDLLQIEHAIVGDVLNVNRRSRMEELDDVLFFSIKSILAEEGSGTMRIEQISFLIQDNLLVSFQEKRSDFFAHIRERIRSGAGVVRKKKMGYLLFLMLDAVMENFFVTIEKYEEEIEDLIIACKTQDNPTLLSKIEKMRENLSFVKRCVIPLRDALYNLKEMDEDSDFREFTKPELMLFGRLHQKSLEILDQIEFDLSNLEGASNVYYASQGQRMNAIMKTLTVFSVIFMPLTFIVGVYGMNFEYMPELKSPYGYGIVWGIMIAVALGMAVYFKKKKWF